MIDWPQYRAFEQDAIQCGRRRTRPSGCLRRWTARSRCGWHMLFIFCAADAAGAAAVDGASVSCRAEDCCVAHRHPSVRWAPSDTCATASLRGAPPADGRHTRGEWATGDFGWKREHRLRRAIWLELYSLSIEKMTHDLSSLTMLMMIVQCSGALTVSD